MPDRERVGHEPDSTPSTDFGLLHNLELSPSSRRLHSAGQKHCRPMVATDEAKIYTVVLRMRSYLVTATEAASIRRAQRDRRQTVSFNALKCCGDCAEGTVRVEEDLAQVRALIVHDEPSSTTDPVATNVIPLFR